MDSFIIIDMYIFIVIAFCEHPWLTLKCPTY